MNEFPAHTHLGEGLLPELSGTPEQISWALRIRSQCIKAAKAELGNWDALMASYREGSPHEEWPIIGSNSRGLRTRSVDYPARKQMVLAWIEDFLRRQVQAYDWIADAQVWYGPNEQGPRNLAHRAVDVLAFSWGDYAGPLLKLMRRQAGQVA